MQHGYIGYCYHPLLNSHFDIWKIMCHVISDVKEFYFHFSDMKIKFFISSGKILHRIISENELPLRMRALVCVHTSMTSF